VAPAATAATVAGMATVSKVEAVLITPEMMTAREDMAAASKDTELRNSLL
jgi:hypothetical protein